MVINKLTGQWRVISTCRTALCFQFSEKGEMQDPEALVHALRESTRDLIQIRGVLGEVTLHSVAEMVYVASQGMELPGPGIFLFVQPTDLISEEFVQLSVHEIVTLQALEQNSLAILLHHDVPQIRRAAEALLLSNGQGADEVRRLRDAIRLGSAHHGVLIS